MANLLAVKIEGESDRSTAGLCDPSVRWAKVGIRNG